MRFCEVWLKLFECGSFWAWLISSFSLFILCAASVSVCRSFVWNVFSFILSFLCTVCVGVCRRCLLICLITCDSFLVSERSESENEKFAIFVSVCRSCVSECGSI